jgi:Zn-dependent M28 family amino/carboxypeptidase
LALATSTFSVSFSTHAPLTSCLARVSAKNQDSTKPALLLNCHLDGVYAGPAASDDGAACAIYLDLLEVLARRPHALENDLIVLFNGGEVCGV